MNRSVREPLIYYFTAAPGAPFSSNYPPRPENFEGLKVGDVILTIGGRPIRKASDATSEIHMHRVGESLEVTVLRDDGPLTMVIRMSP